MDRDLKCMNYPCAILYISKISLSTHVSHIFERIKCIIFYCDILFECLVIHVLTAAFPSVGLRHLHRRGSANVSSYHNARTKTCRWMLAAVWDVSIYCAFEVWPQLIVVSYSCCEAVVSTPILLCLGNQLQSRACSLTLRQWLLWYNEVNVHLVCIHFAVK